MDSDLDNTFELLGRKEVLVIAENQQLKDNLTRAGKKNKATWLGLLTISAVVGVFFYLKWRSDNRKKEL